MTDKDTIEDTIEESTQFTVVDDPSEKTVADDDELDKYTKNVSKRINNLNKRNREAEERAIYVERLLVQKNAENQALINHTQQLSSGILFAEEQSIQAKEAQADDLYKKAVTSGDADLMSKADTLKSDLSIQKEKLRVAKNRQQPVQQQPVQQQQFVQEQPVQQQQPVNTPTPEALSWKEKNEWFQTEPDHSSPIDYAATNYAQDVHNDLVGSGVVADSDEYYEELNSRVFKVFPELEETSKNAGKNDASPAVQRVTSTSVGSRQKTRAKKRNGVTFSKSEIARLKGLKPHNMDEEDWFKRVAKEKYKISQREVG